MIETGTLSFTEMGAALNVTSPVDGSFSSSWGDFDNDGDLDLLVGGASNERWVLHRNNLRESGTPDFTDVTGTQGLPLLNHVRAALFFDMESDGDLDILVGRSGTAPPPRLYENEGPAGDFFELVLEGTDSNRDGTGARVTLRAGGREIIREAHRSTSGLNLQVEVRHLHFGLGDIETIDAATINWPSGCVQTLEDVPANQIRPVTESCVVRIAIDIKPGSCPNPLNPKERGVVTAAILGSADVDVADIDAASVRLEGLAPVRSSVADVATPFAADGDLDDALDCHEALGDGVADLVLKFDARDLIAAIEAAFTPPPLEDGDIAVLRLDGALADATPIEGADVVLFRIKGRP